jgi:putative sterol carrier protein
MAHIFPSQEWVDQLKTELNRSAAYRSSAKTWEGDLFFVVELEGGKNKTAKMYLDLWHGECRAAYMVPDSDSKKAEFLITGASRTFRKIFEKKLDPIQALMTRQLKLQGDMMKIMRAVKATLDLVKCCSLIDTVYPDMEPVAN